MCITARRRFQTCRDSENHHGDLSRYTIAAAPPSPRSRGEGWGEGALCAVQIVASPPARVPPSPRAGGGGGGGGVGGPCVRYRLPLTRRFAPTSPRRRGEVKAARA